MARTDANPPMMPYTDQYQLVEVDADYLTKAVKPKQFIHIDQSECIMCEGCVDICPWKCIHMVDPNAVAEAIGTEQPGLDPRDNVMFIIDDDVCTRCASTVAPPASSFSARSAHPPPPAILTHVPTTTATPTECVSRSTPTWQRRLTTNPHRR